MSNRRRALAALLLIVGALLMADTFLQNIIVNLPFGLAVFLYGLFWLSAE
jgi:hypothetical protein